jgi:hypothetical protein
MKDLRDTDKALESGCVQRDGVTYGCHVDGEGPDGCVLSYGSPRDCNHAIFLSGRERRSRWTCPHWRKVGPA